MLLIYVLFVTYMSSQKGEFIIFGCTRLLCVCLVDLIKHFAGNFSACINKYLRMRKVSKPVL